MIDLTKRAAFAFRFCHGSARKLGELDADPVIWDAANADLIGIRPQRAEVEANMQKRLAVL